MIIKRNNYLIEIRDFYESNLIKILSGPRYVGKTTLIAQIKEDLVKNYNISMDHIISINFEDEVFHDFLTPQKLNKFLTAQFKDSEKYYLFLDEIQHVEQYERILASLKAVNNVSLFVTGSNSKLLSGSLATLLVGRCKEFKIMPFSYFEFLEYHKANNISLPQDPLNNYMKYGGMLQRLDYSDELKIKDYLLGIYNGIVEKDICNSKGYIDKDVFISVSKYIIANATKEFSATSIVNYYNQANPDKIYRETVYRYLEKMEEACLINRVGRYDIASKRMLNRIEKHYLIDPGFLFACSSTNNTSLTHALENVVYNELISRGYDVKIGKTYKGEIDFVAMKYGKKCFIQVAYILADDVVIDREFSAFDSIRDHSPKYVLSLDKFDFSHRQITHINIEEWLLNKKELFIS